MTRPQPSGVITRGTTGPDRLRRSDRWLLTHHAALLRRPDLLVVDLGFGASPVTTIELAHRLRRVNPSARVVGVDINADRVAAAEPFADDRLAFRRGGFELAGLRPHVVRAFNVLRQYDETAVAGAWQQMRAALQPGGLVLDGTCDEMGRLGSWVSLATDGPTALTLALDHATAPSTVAARLPKALIHRNVPGEGVHRLLTDLDAAWGRHAALRAFGTRQRLAASVADLRRAGWPLLDSPSRWRRGEVTVAWRAISSLEH